MADVTIKDYADMPLVEINGKVYVDREIFKGYALNLLEQKLKMNYLPRNKMVLK